jgi:hypothetical protein
MHALNLSSSTIVQRAVAVKKAMKEVRKLRTERQINDALNIRNDSLINLIHDLSLNSNVLV